MATWWNTSVWVAPTFGCPCCGRGRSHSTHRRGSLYVFARPQRGGVSLAVDLDWKLAGRIGLTGKLGWKTDGWLMGEPLGEGLYGWIGLAFYADADGALFKWRT